MARDAEILRQFKKYFVYPYSLRFWDGERPWRAYKWLVPICVLQLG